MTQIIFAYNRKDAIRDGMLIDVSEVAEEAGFGMPVALTRIVWDRYVELPATVTGQDDRGRLWEILWMLRQAVTACRRYEAILYFRMFVRNDNRQSKLITLRAVCGPDEDERPVITIMLPGEE